MADSSYSPNYSSCWIVSPWVVSIVVVTINEVYTLFIFCVFDSLNCLCIIFELTQYRTSLVYACSGCSSDECNVGLLCLLTGMSYLHDLDIIHRDLKSSNGKYRSYAGVPSVLFVMTLRMKAVRESGTKTIRVVGVGQLVSIWMLIARLLVWVLACHKRFFRCVCDDIKDESSQGLWYQKYQGGGCWPIS